MSNIITVKVVVVPGLLKEVVLDGTATVQDALNAASVSADGHAIQVNGESVSLNTTVNDGDRIIVAKSSKSA